MKWGIIMKNVSKVVLLSTLLLAAISLGEQAQANEPTQLPQNDALYELESRNYGEAWTTILNDTGQMSVSAAKYTTIPSGYRALTRVDEARDLLRRYYGPNGWLKPVDQYVEQDGDVQIVNERTLAVGDEVITNNTTQQMDIKTAQFEHTEKFTTSTTTTNAFKLGLKASYSLKIYSAQIGTEINTEYSFTHSGTQSKEESKKYTIPSQNIPTLPGHTYKLEYILSIGKARGNVKYIGDVHGFVPYAMRNDNRGSYSLKAGNAVKAAERDSQYVSAGYKNKFEYKDIDTMRYTGGRGYFEADYGISFRLKVTDITHGEKSAPVYYEIEGLEEETLNN